MDPWTFIFSTLVVYTSGFRIVCYYTYPTQKRTVVRKLLPQHLNPNLCTHLVYSHVRIDGLKLIPLQEDQKNADDKLGMYHEVMNLKIVNPKLMVLLAVGNFTESPESFLKAAESKSSRAAFAKSVALYLRSKRFNGAQLEWANFGEQKDPRYDKQKFLLLLKALKGEFKKTKKNALILAATLPANKKHIDSGYSIKELAEETDFITIRTLDMYTDGKVGLSAPFRSNPSSTGDDRYLSVEWITKYYLSLNVPEEKINIGIPTYGRTFELKNESRNKIGDDAVIRKGPKPQSATDNIVGYAKVCQLILGDGSVEHDESQDGRYYTHGKMWISYEDILSVSHKNYHGGCFADWTSAVQLSGVTFWTLNLDDFTGLECQHGDYPLIRTAVHLLTYTDTYMCDELNMSMYVDVPPPLISGPPILVPVAPKGEKRIVCYYTNWAQFRQGKGKFLPENIDAHLCTHIVYAYAVLKDYTVGPFLPNDESKPWIEGMFGRVVRAKKQNPDLKVLLGIGGGSSAFETLGNLIKDTTILEDFARRITSYLEERCFDGLEVTWQHPSVRWKPNFAYFIQILRMTFDQQVIFHGPPQLLLSVAMTASKKKIDSGYGEEISRIASSVDFISIMTYDFYSRWDAKTGHNSPLFSNPDGSPYEKHLSVDWVAKYYLSLGVPKHKMDIGIATYGRSFTLRNADQHDILSPVKGPGTAGEFTGVAGLLSYYEICNFISNETVVTYVPSQRVNYIYNGTQWVGFDDTESVFQKACYVMHNGFGGVNVRTLDFDDFTGEFCKKGKYPLLTTINSIITHPDKSVCKTFQMLQSKSKAFRTICGTTMLYIHLGFLWLVGRLFLK